MTFRPESDRPVMPAHFYPRPIPEPRPGDPALPYRRRYFVPPPPPGARAPCGVVLDRTLTRWTNDPQEVTCRGCIRSVLVQSLLAAGEGPCDFGDTILDAWNLRVRRH